MNYWLSNYVEDSVRGYSNGVLGVVELDFVAFAAIAFLDGLVHGLGSDIECQGQLEHAVAVDGVAVVVAGVDGLVLHRTACSLLLLQAFDGFAQGLALGGFRWDDGFGFLGGGLWILEGLGGCGLRCLECRFRIQLLGRFGGCGFRRLGCRFWILFLDRLGGCRRFIRMRV